MPKSKINLSKLFIPSDFVAIVVIIVGLLIAIFLDEIAIRLIGVSISVLGVVSLVMLISQRITDEVAIRHTPKEKPQVYKVTKSRDKSATRTVIEDFDISLETEKAGEDSEIDEKSKAIEEIKKEISVAGKTKQEKPEFKPKPQEKPAVRPVPVAKSKQETQDTEKKKTAEPAKKPEPPKKEFMDQDEGFRIVKKPAKTAYKGDEEEKEESSEQKKQTVNIPSNTTKNPAIISKKEEKPSDKKQVQESADREKTESLSENGEDKPEVKKEPEKSAVKPPEKEDAKIPGNEVQEKKAEKATEKPPEDKNKKTVPPPAPEPEKPKKTFTKTFVSKELDDEQPVLTEEIPLFGQEPRKEFEYFLSRVMKIIRSVTNTRTAAFVLVNQVKQELILESYETDVEKAISDSRKFPVGDDIVSGIIKNSKPEILEEINPEAELDLIPYYQRKVNTSSFIGMPVFFRNKVIGVICADSNVSDVYDSVTVTFLGHVSKLLSTLVQSYTDKFDLIQDSRMLEAINKFSDIMDSRADSVEDIADSLVEAASVIFDYDRMGICTYDEMNEKWILLGAKGIDTKKVNRLDIERSLAGEAILSNHTVMLSPVEDNIIRVYKGEPDIKGGYFVAVPLNLNYIGSSFGTLFLEGKKSEKFTTNDLRILKKICSYAGSAIEKIHIRDMLQNSALFDIQSGMLNAPAFHYRMQEEFQRAHDSGNHLAMCLVKIDKYASYDNESDETIERILYHAISIIREKLRAYDLFGRVGADVFGIIRPDTEAEKLKMWTEKLRQEIANTELNINDRSYTVTISAGIAQSGPKDSPEDLMANSRQALEIAVDKSNNVSVFS